MADGLDQQITQPATHEELGFEERLALLVDRETTYRTNNKVIRLLKAAKLKVQAQHNDILEIMEDRHGLRSTLITSQLPIDQWHKAIGDATLADAILDRLLHNSHKVKLKDESVRKAKNEIADVADST